MTGSRVSVVPLMLASMMPAAWLVKAVVFCPRRPWPWMRLLTFVRRVPVTAELIPATELPVNVTDPPPVRVRPPAWTSRSVALPREVMVMEPVLVIVPPRPRSLLSLARRVPALVRAKRKTFWLPLARITPVPMVERVPPVMATSDVSCTSEPSSASIRLLLVKAPPPLPERTRMPPLLARRIPALRKEGPRSATLVSVTGSIVRAAPLTLAWMIPAA